MRAAVLERFGEPLIEAELELAGIGSAVTMFAPGDHVVGAPSACCGRCGYCLRGLTQHCADKGQTRTGGGPDQVLDVVGLGATIEQA